MFTTSVLNENIIKVIISEGYMSNNDGTGALAIYEQPRTVLIPTEQTSNSAFALAKLAASSGLCKTRQPADAFFIIMYGYELGIPAMTALRTIHIINNTPVCSGEAMLALIRRSGKVTIKITGTATEATVYMKRKDTEEEYTARWDIKRAETAGLTKKTTWQQFPQAFLQWRGVSECGKFLCSDIIGGLYTFEEIAPDLPVDIKGEPVEVPTMTIEKPAEENKPELPLKWYSPEALQQLAERACANKWIEHCGDEGVKELRQLIEPKTWDDFETRAAAGVYIQQVVQDTLAELERQKTQIIPKRAYVTVTSARYFDSQIIVVTPDGDLKFSKTLLKSLIENGNPNDRLNGERQLKEMHLEDWTAAPNIGSTYDFPELRVDYIINGELKLVEARGTTDWRNKPAEKVNAAPVTEEELDSLPEIGD